MKTIICLKISTLLFALLLPLIAYQQDVISDSLIKSFTDGGTTDGLSLEYIDELNSENLYLGVDSAGITPIDILYIELVNKIYLLGSSRLCILDSETLTVDTILAISQYGQFNKEYFYIDHESEYLAYDGMQTVFCFSNSFKIHAIDIITNSIVQTLELEAFSPNSKYEQAILKYSDYQDYLYLVVTDPSFWNPHSHCYRLDPNNLEDYSYFTMVRTIFDFEINSADGKIFITYSEPIGDQLHYYFSVFSNLFQPIPSIAPFEYDEKYINIVYLNDPATNTHSAYAFPKWGKNVSTFTEALVFNANDYSKSTVRLENWQQNVKSTYSSQSDGIIYFAYENNNDYGVGKINYSNNLVSDINITAPYHQPIDIITNSEKIFLSLRDKVVVIEKVTPNNYFTHYYKDDMILKLEKSSTNIFAINHENCALEVFNSSGGIESSKIMGGSSLLCSFSDDHNKLLTYNPTIMDSFQRVNIIDVENHDWELVDIEDLGFANISGLVVDDERNMAYVSLGTRYVTSNPISVIKKIDLLSNSLMSGGFDLPVNSTCRGIFLNNDKLYCVIDKPVSDLTHFTSVYIIDLENPTNTNEIIIQGYNNTDDISIVTFESTEADDVLMCIRKRNEHAIDKFVYVSGSSNTILYEFDIAIPYAFCYASSANKVFFTQFIPSAFLGVVDIINQSVHYIDVSSITEHTIVPVYDSFRDKVCILSHNPVSADNRTKFIWIDPTTESVSFTAEVEPMAISINYNDINGQLYSFYPKGIENRQHLGITPLSSLTTQLFMLNNGERIVGPNSSYYHNQIFNNTEEGYLYIPNNFFSNIHRIELPEEFLILRPNITWLSFPKLEREGNDPVDAVQVLTGRITPDNFNYGKMSHNEVLPNPAGPPHSQSMTYIEKPDHQHPWNPQPGLLQNVQSTKGYILEIVPESPGMIDLYGSRLDPSTSFPLYTGVDNWTGYFLTYPQDVFDAFEPILDYVYSVKTQDWAIVRQHPPGGGGGGPDDFLQPSHPLILEYGDLAIVEVMQDIPEFTWNNLAPANQGSEVLMAETFSYEELSTYTPIYMQLDTAENPAEIGAFVNDSCIGACVVSTDDTLAALRAYTGELTGEITFQQYYGPTKSSNRKIDSYLVYEPGLDAMVNRTIHTGEGKDFYLVSLKTGNSPVASYSNGISLQVLPNPCSDQCGLRYAITSTCDVTIEVFNATGIRLNSFTYGQQPAGQYNFSIPGPCRPGVYIIKLSACGSSKVKKLVITR